MTIPVGVYDDQGSVPMYCCSRLLVNACYTNEADCRDDCRDRCHTGDVVVDDVKNIEDFRTHGDGKLHDFEKKISPHIAV